MKRRRIWILVLLLAGLAAGWWWYFLKFRVVEVLPGEFYRAPQISARHLRGVLQARGVGLVINLRGTGRGKTWYGEEKKVCAEAGIDHRTVTFDMDGWPPRHRVVEMMDALDSTDKPILTHCLRGVDRAGWASTVAVLADGASLNEALRQLSAGTGHLCRRRRCPQHRFFALYRRFLDEREAVNSARLFRTWVEEEYCPPDSDAEIEILTPLQGHGVPGERVNLRVRVRNRGEVSWVMGQDGVRLGVRAAGPFAQEPEKRATTFLDQESKIVDLGRADLNEESLPTNREAVFDLSFRLPGEPGFYVLQINMLQESVRWFSDVGSLGRLWEIEVGPPISVAAGSEAPSPSLRPVTPP